MDLAGLKQVGLTDGEVRIYEALLRKGEMTKTNLAKESEVSPSNIYDITNRLLEKGIISKVEKNRVAHFSAVNPRHLLDFIEEKKNELVKEKKIVMDMLPSLITNFNKTEEKVNVEVFNGWGGMKIVFEDLLNESKKGDINYVLGASKGKDSQQADLFFNKYSRLRADKGIVTQIIFNEELKKDKERMNFFYKSKLYKIRFMQQVTPSEIMIYQNKTCIIILSEEPIVIRVTSKEVQESFKQYFEIMWKISKK